jgi:hypothetical protein
MDRTNVLAPGGLQYCGLSVHASTRICMRGGKAVHGAGGRLLSVSSRIIPCHHLPIYFGLDDVSKTGME